MTTEDKARDHAYVEKIRSREVLDDLPLKKQIDIRREIATSAEYSFIAGANSRDAEVAELKAQIKELMEWISVEDILPKPNTKVLIRYIVNDNVLTDIAGLDHSGKWYRHAHYFLNVTHWRRI